MNAAEFVVDGILFPEGLAWSPDDQTLLVTSVQEGVVYKVLPGEHRKIAFADIGGGANNVALARGAEALVTQNGGLDAYPSISRSFPDVAPWPAIRHATPGLVHIDHGGTITNVLVGGVEAPNDLVVDRDNTVYFTDPGNPFLAKPRNARVMALSTTGELRTVASGFDYCNGIEIEGDGILLVTDHEGLLRVAVDSGEVEWVAKGIANPAPDGVTVDRDGRVYVATSREAVVRVLENGRVVESLTVPGEGSVSNCCFGGPNHDWLFVTDTRHGRVMVFTDMATPGRPAYPWSPLS